MLTAVTGYYDGDKIVTDENVKLSKGQKVIITILDTGKNARNKVDLSKYMGRGEKMFHEDAQEYEKSKSFF